MKTPNLEKWLADDRADIAFGRSFVIRFTILANRAAGHATPLRTIAAEHGLTRQAMSRHVAKVKRAYPELWETKHCES